VFVPGILGRVGDVSDLAALAAPRRVVIAGGVSGQGEPLASDALRSAYADPTTSLTLLNSTDPVGVVRAIRGEEVGTLICRLDGEEKDE